MAFTHSPLRYPGGKSSLAPFLSETVHLNGLSGCTYIEPYAGGAGAALSLLFQNDVNHIIINDFDIAIYSFWVSILNNFDSFVRKISNTDVTIDEWHRQHYIIKQAHKHAQLDVGFAAFFLNRCNRSGILKAGPIGGKRQIGKYKINARFNKHLLIKKIESIYSKRKNISVYNHDALDFIQNIQNDVKGKKLLYLDPPYYEKGSQLYLNSYDHEDHRNLAWLLTKNIDKSWILTYDDVTEVHDLYLSHQQSKYILNYFAHHAKKGSELIIAPQEIKLPQKVVTRYGLC